MRINERRRIGEMASNELDTRAVLTLVLGDAFAKLSDVRWSHATNSVAQVLDDNNSMSAVRRQ